MNLQKPIVPFDGIIFDLDGTLIDSAPTVTAILNELRRELGKPELSPSYLIPWLSLGGEQLMEKGLGIPLKSTGYYLNEFRQRYSTQKTTSSCIYENVDIVLTTLKECGVKLGIVTNKPRILVNKILTETWLGNYFEHVIAGDDLQTRKPNRENLFACLEKLELEPKRVIMVGDSTVDQEMSKLAGVRFSFFSSGYDDGVNLVDVHSVFKSYTYFFQSITI